eukprot:3865592-Lingulodinium_polyedra.AAC.1
MECARRAISEPRGGGRQSQLHHCVTCCTRCTTMRSIDRSPQQRLANRTPRTLHANTETSARMA